MTALPCAFFAAVTAGGESKTSNDCITLCFLLDRFWDGRTGGGLASPALQYRSVSSRPFVWEGEVYGGRLQYLVLSFRPVLWEGSQRRQMTALPCAFFSTVCEVAGRAGDWRPQPYITGLFLLGRYCGRGRYTADVCSASVHPAVVTPSSSDWVCVYLLGSYCVGYMAYRIRRCFGGVPAHSDILCVGAW